MYSVSDDYITAIMSSGRTVYWYGTITTTAGAVYDIDSSDIISGSASITRDICSSESLEVGTTCSAELRLTIYNEDDRYAFYGASIEIYFRLYLDDDTYEDVPCGIYTVEDASRTAKTLTLIAYDNMVNFEGVMSSIPDGGTPYEMIAYACDSCGVTLETTQTEIEALVNGTMSANIYTADDTMTYKDFLSGIATMMCAYCKISRTGGLLVEPYGSSSVRTFTSSDRYGSEIGDFISNYTSVSYITETGETVYLTGSVSDTGLTYKLGSNIITRGNSESTVETWATNLLESLILLQFTPYTMDIPYDPALDVGDLITISTDNGSVVSVITNSTLKLSGAQELKCVGDNPRLQESKTSVAKQVETQLANLTSNQYYMRTYTNASAISVADGDDYKTILSCTNAAITSTVLMFNAEVLCDITLTDGETEAVLDVKYTLNGTEITYHPIDTFTGGQHLLHLVYPIPISSGVSTRWMVYLTATGGSVDIEANTIQAIIGGSGLASASSWDGTIEVEETIDNIAISNIAFDSTAVSDTVSIATQTPTAIEFSETTSTIDIPVTAFDSTAVTDTLEFDRTVTNAYVDETTASEMTYDSTYVTITDSNFVLQTAYTYTSTESTIDSGLLSVVTVDTSGFASVESIEVS